MLTIEQLYRRLAEKGYRHRKVEELLRAAPGAALPPEVLDRVEELLHFDLYAVFSAWFGEGRYKPHFRRATIEWGEGAIPSMLDYVRRLG